MHSFLVAALVAALSASALSQNPSRQKPPEKPARISGEGCVEPGAEPRCLVVRDLRHNRAYSLLFDGMPPEIGAGIEFTAVPHRGVAVCMQGTALDVLSWSRRAALRCRRPVPPARQSSESKPSNHSSP